MQEALLAYLTGAGSGLPALVGTRIAWGLNDQGGALPRVSLRHVSEIPGYADDGEAGLTQSRVQVDCYASTYEGAEAIWRAIKLRVSGVVVTHQGVEFQGMQVSKIRDDSDVYDGGRVVHVVQGEILFPHT